MADATGKEKGKDKETEKKSALKLQPTTTPAKRRAKPKTIAVHFPESLGRRSSVPSATPNLVPELDERADLGRQVLALCRVLRHKSPKSPLRQLRKGEGHVMSGFGMSNREVYDRIFAT